MKKRVYGSVIGGVLVIILIIVVLSRNHGALAAQAADNILRPLLGSQKTVLLESIVLNSLDTLNRLTYTESPNALSSGFHTSALEELEKEPLAMHVPSLPINHYLPPLLGEGVWQGIHTALFPNQDVMLQTVLRPDPQRPYAVVSLVLMDTRFLGFGLQGGTYYPGEAHHVYGPGIVPKEIVQSNNLVAAFNGGFQEKDGAYGMVLGQSVYVPIRSGLPALELDTNGNVQFTSTPSAQLPPGVAAFRQNGPYLVQNGQITQYVEAGTDTWGRTISDSIYTWRSGVGITRDGKMIYAVGSALVPRTLAEALKRAGAVNAIQLDINPYWVRFTLFTPLGNGNYQYVPLVKDMQNGGYAFLHGDNKDFFYVYKK